MLQDLDVLEHTPQSESGDADHDEPAAESLRLLGEAFRGKDQLTDALNFFNASVAKASKLALIYISRGRCCLDMEKKGMRPPDSPAKPTKKERVSPLCKSLPWSLQCLLRYDHNFFGLW